MLKSGLLFGSGLPKQVKELTEVDRVGKKVSRHSGIRSMTKSDIITRLDFQSFWESGCLSSSQLPLDQWSVTLAHDLTSTFSMQIIKKWKSFGQCKENCKTNKNKYFGVTRIKSSILSPNGAM